MGANLFSCKASSVPSVTPSTLTKQLHISLPRQVIVPLPWPSGKTSVSLPGPCPPPLFREQTLAGKNILRNAAQCFQSRIHSSQHRHPAGSLVQVQTSLPPRRVGPLTPLGSYAHQIFLQSARSPEKQHKPHSFLLGHSPASNWPISSHLNIWLAMSFTLLLTELGGGGRQEKAKVQVEDRNSGPPSFQHLYLGSSPGSRNQKSAPAP